LKLNALKPQQHDYFIYAELQKFSDD